MKIVLDTNILVSALLNPIGTPARILELIIDHQLTLLMDDRILYEYRDVLNRPKFKFDSNDIDELLSFLDRIGEYIIATPYSKKIPDMNDIQFLEVALEGKADVLITGNKKDFGRAPKSLKILSPKDFLELYKKLK